MIALTALALAGVTAPTVSRFQCGGAVVVARYSKDRVRIDFTEPYLFTDRHLRLERTVSADGARYTGLSHNRRAEFWTRGDWARLSIGKKFWPDCRLANLPAG